MPLGAITWSPSLAPTPHRIYCPPVLETRPGPPDPPAAQQPGRYPTRPTRCASAGSGRVKRQAGSGSAEAALTRPFENTALCQLRA